MYETPGNTAALNLSLVLPWNIVDKNNQILSTPFAFIWANLLKMLKTPKFLQKQQTWQPCILDLLNLYIRPGTPVVKQVTKNA